METKNSPLCRKTQILVCGGGTAGVFAAIAAAGEGKDVLIVEQFGSLGGTPTNGLVTPLMGTGIKEEPTCSYLSNEVDKRMLEYGAADKASKRRFDPLILKIVLEEMCEEAGVKIMLHTSVADVIKENGEIKSVVILNKKGLQRIEADIYIDATGDGDVSVFAGAEYTKGNPDTGKNQPISLRYIISNIDMDALVKFTEQEKERVGVNRAASVEYTPEFSYYASVTGVGECTFTDLFKQAIANGDLIEDDMLYWQLFVIPGRPGSLAYNCPEFFDFVDGTDPEHLTYTQLKGRKAVFRQLNFYKKYMKGFENAYIAEIAPMVGIRESRNITTEYVLTGEDLIGRRKFNDHFSQSNYPMDIHGRKLDFNSRAAVDDGKPYYEVPYGTIVVKGVDNLFVVGRCFGADFYAQSALRIQYTLRSSGEAAGFAAVMAIDGKIKPKDIDGVKVREKMISKGARFLED